MATTLQNIIGSATFATFPIPPDRIYVGLSDRQNPADLATPYMVLTDFQQRAEYDTGGIVFVNSTFKLRIFSADPVEAESIAEAVNAAMDLSTTLTPTTARVFNDGYERAQEPFYVEHIALTYTLIESP